MAPRVPWTLIAGLAFLICAAASAQQTITLGWDAENDPSVAGYVVYYGTASQQYSVRLDVGTNLTATIASLSSLSNYYFAVTSYYADGVESVPSPEITFSGLPSQFLAGQTSVAMVSTVPNSSVTTTEFLQFPDGVNFGYYTLVAFPWFYHADMGYEYLFEANDGAAGVFLWDLNSKTFFYTNPQIFPFLYDFTLNSWLYYYPDGKNPGHYTSSPRYFYNFAAKQIISK